MAVIHPFRAWRPTPDQVTEVACVPYDVINTEEAKTLAQGKEHSFLHVIRPEIDLPDEVDIHDEAVYVKGAKNLNQMKADGILSEDEDRAVYIYRLETTDRSQVGLFTCVSVEDYDNEVILKHELTRPAKEDDRTKHILTQRAHAEPVMMTFKDTESITDAMQAIMNEDEPLYHFTANDGVAHAIWKVADAEPFTEAFRKIPHLYIADGHHRCKSASRAAAEMNAMGEGSDESAEHNFFPAVLFPVDQMTILAYNRILREVPDEAWEILTDRFTVTPGADPKPQNKGEISIYYKSEWHKIALPEFDEPDSVQQLDVERLQHFVLDPVFGIKDQRSDKNLDFVGGIRGTEALEVLVDGGKAELAISMYPTSVEELIAVSDEGKLMPPKSTWFEPKLRSGILVHTF